MLWEGDVLRLTQAWDIFKEPSAHITVKDVHDTHLMLKVGDLRFRNLIIGLTEVNVPRHTVGLLI
jgi:hypothetical protein